jgi:hypothetical protein
MFRTRSDNASLLFSDIEWLLREIQIVVSEQQFDTIQAPSGDASHYLSNDNGSSMPQCAHGKREQRWQIGTRATM